MKFSIVIPSFNQGQFIQRTIDSVLGQKGDFEVECMVMDGGSTDNTVEILKGYGDKIFWVSEEDNGQSHAINKGLRRATGDVCAYINSDDTYVDGAFSRVADFFKKHPEKMWLYGKCHIVDERDVSIRKWISFYKHVMSRHYCYFKLLAENFISQPAVFLRKEVFEGCGYFDEDQHLVMDYEYWLRIGEKYYPGVLLEYVANFRIHGESKGSGFFKKQFREEYAVAKKYAKGSRLVLWLHKLNYYKIVGVYSVMQWFKKSKKQK